MVNSSSDSLENTVLVVVTETVSKKGTLDNYQRINSTPKALRITIVMQARILITWENAVSKSIERSFSIRIKLYSFINFLQCCIHLLLILFAFQTKLHCLINKVVN